MTRSLVTLGLLALSACRDAGEDRLALVKTRYSKLVGAGAAPQSADFDALVAELSAIDASSRAHGGAQALLGSIEAARQGRVGRPLAVAAGPLPELSAPDELVARLRSTREACERLARGLGGLVGAARAERLAELDACRRQSDALEDEVAHHDGAGHDGGHRR